MNRLIKAEWYKLLRSTKIFWFTLAAIIGIEVWNFSGLANTLKGHLTLDAYITGNSTMIVLGAFMLVILLAINCCMTPAMSPYLSLHPLSVRSPLQTSLSQTSMMIS